MPFNFADLKPGQIAALAAAATAFASIVAFVGALTVSLVNAWAARRLDAAKAKREYLMKSFMPVLDFIETTVRSAETHFQYVEEFGSSDKPERLTDEWRKELLRLMEVGSKQFAELTAMGPVHLYPNLKEPYDRYSEALGGCRRSSEGLFDGRGFSPEPTKVAAARPGMQESLKRLRAAALAFRIAVEEILF